MEPIFGGEFKFDQFLETSQINISWSSEPLARSPVIRGDQTTENTRAWCPSRIYKGDSMGNPENLQILIMPSWHAKKMRTKIRRNFTCCKDTRRLMTPITTEYCFGVIVSIWMRWIHVSCYLIIDSGSEISLESFFLRDPGEKYDVI